MSSIARALLLLALTLLSLTACTAYKLGSGTELPFRTLYIEPIVSRADIPQAVGLYSNELRQVFLRDGRVALVNSPEAADAVLSVVLEGFSRNATASREDDTRLARKFDLDVQAQATLRDNRTGKNLFEKREIKATRQIYTTATAEGTFSRQQQAEYQTQPLLAKELAERTRAAVLDTW